MRISLSAARRLMLVLTLAVAAPQALQARVEPSHGFDMFSAQEEVQAGQQAAAQVGKQLATASRFRSGHASMCSDWALNWLPTLRVRSGRTPSTS